MQESVVTSTGVKISIRHKRKQKNISIIIAHGFFQSKETQTFRKIEDELLDHFDTISMDFRGHGKSDGLYTFSAYEKEDLKAVVDYARKDYQKVGVLGFSYGGSIALIEQAEFKNIDSLVCVSSPMASEKIKFKWWTPSAIKLGLKGLERGAGVRPGNPYLKKIRPIDIVQDVMPTPVFFIHGDQDPTVDHSHSQQLYETAREPKKLKIFQRGSHAEELYRKHPRLFIQDVVEWFKATLGD